MAARPDTLFPGELLIDDSTPTHLLFDPVVDGEMKGRGGIPRDFRVDPPDMFDPPGDMPLIPKSEWSDRIKHLSANEALLSHVRGDLPSYDQNGQGFCWFYSNTGVVTILRKKANMPYIRFSAHAGACKIKNFKDEGGWCGLSAKFWKERGCPSTAFWAEKSMSKQYDTEATWANAAQHKVTEDWVDVARPVYDQNLTFEQVVSCLLSGIPCAVDFNWWGHSVCALDVVEVEPGDFGIRIWNSWGDGWGERGMSVLRGSKARPDGAVALRVTTPSDN